jgi:hypothetical protein
VRENTPPGRQNGRGKAFVRGDARTIAPVPEQFQGQRRLDTEFDRQVRELHSRGPQVLLEFLERLGAALMVRTAIEQLLARFLRLDRLPPEVEP